MKQIILVEDDPAIVDSLSLFLQSIDVQVRVYPNGTDILSGNYAPPDLFLLDKQLSGVDGMDICRHLKSIEASRDIPVIMMSASPDVIKLALLAGADDAIIKPFKSTEIKSLLLKYLNHP